MTTVFTVIGVKKLIYQTLQDDYGVLPNGGGSLGGGVVTGGLTQAQVQTLIDTAIAGVPQSAGVTLQQVEASIAAAVSNLPAPGLGEPAVLELLEEKLTEFGPMIQQAIQSQFKAMPKSIRLNTDDGKVSIEGLDISGPNKPVSLDMELPDGSLSVNGKRVLTVDDAIDPSGVDTAAVEAALAPLLARIDTLEAELAKKITETDIASLREQAAFAVDETVRLEAQDAEIVAFVIDKYVDKAFFERWENSIVDLFSGVYTNHNELQKLVRDVMDAMNGPTATVQSITEMFWLLNDLLTALVEATGIDFPGGK
jgi:hypothetical protein